MITASSYEGQLLFPAQSFPLSFDGACPGQCAKLLAIDQHYRTATAGIFRAALPMIVQMDTLDQIIGTTTIERIVGTT